VEHIESCDTLCNSSITDTTKLWC